MACADPLNDDLWPHDPRALLDDLWWPGAACANRANHANHANLLGGWVHCIFDISDVTVPCR